MTLIINFVGSNILGNILCGKGLIHDFHFKATLMLWVTTLVAACFVEKVYRWFSPPTRPLVVGARSIMGSRSLKEKGDEETAQLVRAPGRWPWRQGYKSRSLVLHLAVLQSISPLPITYSVIKGHFLSYHAYMVWKVKDPLSQWKRRLRLSPSHLIHHITTMI